MRLFAGILAPLALVVGLIFPGNVAHASPIVVNLSSGTFANPGLVAGSPHLTGTAITWNYTGNFVDPRYVAYVSTFGGFQLVHSTNMGDGAATSNTHYGIGVPAGTLDYSGVEFYYVTFSLPSNATNVSLAFSRIGADDRMQFEINNQVIGYWGDGGGIGQMIGLGSQPSVAGVSFSGNNVNAPNLTNQSLFDIGGQNVLRFWVNNTGSSSVNAASVTQHSLSNPSVLDFRATLSYDVAGVPEPSTVAIWSLLGAVGMTTNWLRRRKTI